MQKLRSPYDGLWSSMSKKRLGFLSSQSAPYALFRSQKHLFAASLQIHTSRGYQARSNIGTPRAPFLSTLQKCFSLESPGGFVIYRTTAYAPTDSDTWEAFRRKFDLLNQEGFNEAAGPDEEVTAARKSWTVQWEENSNMATWKIEDVKRHYDGLFASKALPAGLSHPLCLVATSAAVQSVLDAPSPMPRYEYSLGGHGAPFLVGIDLFVDLDDEDEDDDMKYTGHFNVSVQCLLDGLWPILAEQMCDVEELGRGVGEDEVWSI